MFNIFSFIISFFTGGVKNWIWWVVGIVGIVIVTFGITWVIGVKSEIRDLKEENSNLSWLWLVIFFVVGLVIGWCIPTFISNPTVVEEVFIYDTTRFSTIVSIRLTTTSSYHDYIQLFAKVEFYE